MIIVSNSLDDIINLYLLNKVLLSCFFNLLLFLFHLLEENVFCSKVFYLFVDDPLFLDVFLMLTGFKHHFVHLAFLYLCGVNEKINRRITISLIFLTYFS